jgi:flavodoxin
MNALVLYDSQYGNTERIARAIADTLREFGEVRTVLVNHEHAAELRGVDLLVVGCPTQGWGPTPAMLSFLEGISSEELHGPALACFDTRFKLPRWMTGSATKVMAEKLQEKGISLLVPPESFFVKGKEGPLRGGELDRAAAWAQMLVKEAGVPEPVVQNQPPSRSG